MGTQPLITLGLWAVYAGLALAAIALLLLALWLIGDRARGRKRCRKCWYDLAGTALTLPLRCPECGREHTTERALLRTRRRGWLVLLACFSLLLGSALAAVGLLSDPANLAKLPRWALLEVVRWHPLTGSQLADAAADRLLGTGFEATLTERELATLVDVWIDSPTTFTAIGHDAFTPYLSGQTNDAAGLHAGLISAAGMHRPGLVHRLAAFAQAPKHAGRWESGSALALLTSMTWDSPQAAAACIVLLRAQGEVGDQTSIAATIHAGPHLAAPAAELVSTSDSYDHRSWEVLRAACLAINALPESARIQFNTPELRSRIMTGCRVPGAGGWAVAVLNVLHPPPGEVARHVPDLLRCDGTSGPYVEVLTEISRMILDAGPEAFASLASQLGDSDPQVRFRAAAVLRDAAVQVPAGTPALAQHIAPLIRAIGDVEQSVAYAALDAATRTTARPDVAAALADPALGQSAAQACLDAIDLRATRSSSGLIDIARIARPLGPAAATVRARLKEIAESNDVRARGFARQALQLMDQPALAPQPTR